MHIYFEVKELESIGNGTVFLSGITFAALTIKAAIGLSVHVVTPV